MAVEKGSRVVCVNDKFTKEAMNLIPNRPVEGVTYTVREKVRYITMGGTVGYLLEEITNPTVMHPSGAGTFEPTFNESRFIEEDDYAGIGDMLNGLAEEMDGVPVLEPVKVAS